MAKVIIPIMRRIHQLNLFKKSCPLPKAQLQAHPVQTRKKRSAVHIDKHEKNETESKGKQQKKTGKIKRAATSKSKSVQRKKKNWKGVKNERI